MGAQEDKGGLVVGACSACYRDAHSVGAQSYDASLVKQVQVFHHAVTTPVIEQVRIVLDVEA